MKELNLVEILKDCPLGTTLYSTVCGEIQLTEIKEGTSYPIRCINNFRFTAKGRYTLNEDAECVLFPSKDNRDWSTFKVEKPKWNPDTLQPFDKVLVRDTEENMWRGAFFLYKNVTMPNYPYTCICSDFRHCIPYNDDTKHLLGTS